MYNCSVSTAPRYNPHYTVADYQQWDGDWELWNGVAVAMSPSPTRQHQRILFDLAMLIQKGLAQHAGCHCEVVIDVDWRVSDDTVVRPDLSVACASSDDDYLQEAPTLVAEVLSPSTAHKDQNEKRRLYESQGVGWYLLVDPDARKVIVLSIDGGGQYTETQVSTSSSTVIELHDGCSFEFNDADLFRE